ncbi:MAG TPA: hypothetical protein VIX84_07705 [Acidimicrobiales bacterium]
MAGCVGHGQCFFIVESEVQHRYVQGLVFPGEPLELESVSNESLGNCCEEHCVSHDDVIRLRHLGWAPPDAQVPNWSRTLRLFGSDTLAAELLARTMTDVHRAIPGRLNITVDEAVAGPVTHECRRRETEAQKPLGPSTPLPRAHLSWGTSYAAVKALLTRG